MTSYLIDEILELTKDHKSRPFFEKALREIGEHVMAEEFGELKHQIRTGAVQNPAKYLTTLLKKRMIQVGGDKAKQDPPAVQEKIKTYFEETQLTLFSNFRPVKEEGEVDQGVMSVPYGKEIIPWATFISSSFFTLSTNKAKSDKVMAKFRTLDGDVSVVPLWRGRIKPGDRERGILTAEHAKVLAAIESLWVQQGCQRNKYPSGAVTCFCYVSIRDLAKALDWKSFSGQGLTWLTSMVYDLKTMPYYVDLSAMKLKNINGYGFSLLGDVELAEGKKRGQPETVLKVKFSTPLSVQLLERHAVSRPKELAHIHGELAFLIRLFIEPILIGLDGNEYNKTLSDLIKELSLPAAGWHSHKGKRKQIFEKAVKELNAQKTADGRPIKVSIEKGLYDWMLSAKLGGEEKCIEVQVEEPAGQK
ncbi:MAG TPA: hypothetical protein DER10_10945 [Elusimicrobia bacterium]|nr:hypothetical protein [Elusimicrobiota bacterium]